MKKLTMLPRRPWASAGSISLQSQCPSRRFQICYLTTGGCNQVLGLVLDYCQSRLGPESGYRVQGSQSCCQVTGWERGFLIWLGVSQSLLVCWWAGPNPAHLGVRSVMLWGILQVSGFLVSASWWVTLVQSLHRFPRAGGSQGFLELNPAHWQIKLCLGALWWAGPCLEACLRQLWTQEGFSNLSADRWIYVATQLVAWPVVSQHWHLQAIGLLSWH